jgi:Fe-S cluster assembly iron-binding protein IscA
MNKPSVRLLNHLFSSCKRLHDNRSHFSLFINSADLSSSRIGLTSSRQNQSTTVQCNNSIKHKQFRNFIKQSRSFSTAAAAANPSQSSINLNPADNSTASNLSSSNNSAQSSNLAIHLTASCQQRIEQLRSKYGPETRLRLSVDTGGCSGLSYQFTVEKTPKQQLKLKSNLVSSNNSSSSIDNTSNEEIFDILEGENHLLVIDSISLPVLNGSTIDYQVSLERAGFSVLTNPNANQSCGCGSSFTPASLAQK